MVRKKIVIYVEITVYSAEYEEYSPARTVYSGPDGDRPVLDPARWDQRERRSLDTKQVSALRRLQRNGRIRRLRLRARKVWKQASVKITVAKRKLGSR